MSHSLLAEPYTSPLSLSHIITHTLNTLTPEVTVINTSTSEVVLVTITALSLTQIQIDFFVPRAIRGTIR